MRSKRNTEIRQKMKQYNIRFYEVAEVLSVSESTIYRWLNELNTDHVGQIQQVIDSITGRQGVK